MTKPLMPSQKKGKKAKLTASLVAYMRQQHELGLLNIVEMAKVHGVAAETLRRALRGETWNNLGEVQARTPEQMDKDAAASLEKMQHLISERNTAGDRMLKEIEKLPPTLQDKLLTFGAKVPKNPLEE